MDRSEIVGMLLILADQTHEQLSPQRLAYLASELEKHCDGTEKLRNALKSLLRESRRFPTIAEVEAAMGLKGATDEELANEASSRIAGAMTKYGSARFNGNYDRQREYIGELGWRVVELLGGWQNLCNSIDDNDQLPTFKAQWRGLAMSQASAARRGQANSQVGPSLPEGPAHKAIAELANVFSLEGRK